MLRRFIMCERCKWLELVRREQLAIVHNVTDKWSKTEIFYYTYRNKKQDSFASIKMIQRRIELRLKESKPFVITTTLLDRYTIFGGVGVRLQKRLPTGFPTALIQWEINKLSTHRSYRESDPSHMIPKQACCLYTIKSQFRIKWKTFAVGFEPTIFC